MVSVESPRIELGGQSAIEPALLGNTFTTQLIMLLNSLIVAATYLQDSSETSRAITAQKTRIAGQEIKSASQVLLNFLKTDNHLSKITYLK